MKEGRKFHIFLIFLASALLSVMLVLMRLGGSVNFEEFMSAGRVYDVKPSDLRKSSKGWLYDEQKKGHVLLNHKAGIRFYPGKKARSWSFMYFTVRQMSRESAEGVLKFYNEQEQKIYEQPVSLVRGENMIQLDAAVAAVPVSSVRLVLPDAAGEFISISYLQFRTTPSWFTVPHFLKLFAAAMTASLVFFAVLTVVCRLCWTHPSSRAAGGNGWFADAMQDGMRVYGDFLGSRLGGRLYPHQKRSVRKFLFGLLFVWMIAANAAGWLHDVHIFRYHVLACALLLLMLALVSWERPLQNRSWRGPLMRNWNFLWAGILLCDFFVDGKIESVTGYAMLLAGSVFVFFWQNMEQPERMLRDLMEALEFTFFLGIIYCMVFRMKRPAVDYNGIFKSPEESSMYGVLMGIVFLTELDWLVRDRIASAGSAAGAYKKEGMFASCVKYIAGGASALFFVLRSGHMPGILIFALLGMLYLPRMLKNLFQMAKKCRILLLYLTAALCLAYVFVSVIFVGTKYVPDILGMDMRYEDEVQVTSLQGEERRLYLAQYPQSLSGTRTKEGAKLAILWRSYARRLNLFGHSGRLTVFERKNPPYSGYLDMAYHYGIFILLPYAAFQICVIAFGLKCAFRREGSGNMYMLFLGIAYAGFSLIANTEIPWGHPLWLCFWLSAGYSGLPEAGKTQEKRK